MKIIQTDKAPKAVGPYSQAIIVGDLVFCSGQIGIDPVTGDLVEGTEKQLRQIMKNIEEVLKATGCSLADIFKSTIFLKNISDFQKVNKIYGEYFSDTKPARSTIEVSNLPKGALIEVEVIASR